TVPRPLTPLAAAVRAPGLGAFTATETGVEATVPQGAEVPGLEDIFVEQGPFAQESVSKDRLTLRRRSGGGIASIEVIGTSGEEEEWRRLLARDVDLVPAATPSHLHYLAEVPSVHIVPVEHGATSGLILNVSGPALGDVRIRRAVSLALRRNAIA